MERVPQMVSNALLSRLSRADAHQRTRRSLYARTYIRYGTALGLLVAVSVTLTDQWLWTRLLGDAYSMLAELTSVMVWALPLLVIALASQPLLSSAGRFGMNTALLVLTAALQTGLLAVLFPSLGSPAVAWATLAAFGLWAVLGTLLVRRSLRPGGHDR